MIHSFDARAPYPAAAPAKKRHFHFELNGARVTGFYSAGTPWGEVDAAYEIPESQGATEKVEVECDQK